MNIIRWTVRFAICSCCTAMVTFGASPIASTDMIPAGGGETVIVDGFEFASWGEYFDSEYFQAAGKRCGTLDREMREVLFGSPAASPSDCSATQTDPTTDYDPGQYYVIPVVVHVIMQDNCVTGAISDERVRSQIDILNEDFQALAGTNGAGGTDVRLFFFLANEDPSGNPTTGITRDCNTTWFNDQGAYYNTLAWDPHRYLNIYTNSAQGFLGYVPFLPADGGGSLVGSNSDRVVILHSAFGRNAPFPPYNQGRTATHEVGHYLGMEHTFNGGCASGTNPACYSNGDLICDTNPQSSPWFGCPANPSSCGSSDPYTNYMDYTDDLCMEEFTTEQMRRIRCTLEFYRPDLYSLALFIDLFEAGNLLLWSDVLP